MASTDPTPNPAVLVGLLRTMLRIRAFENAAEQASQGGVSAFGKAADGRAKVRGPLHLSTGQEATADRTPWPDASSTSSDMQTVGAGQWD
jgi:TPP-dependent pyruvate/acetoin dehydrogenase alpha subunit